MKAPNSFVPRPIASILKLAGDPSGVSAFFGDKRMTSCSTSSYVDTPSPLSKK
jgi:hypothetical protein